jgi:TM2 domain-containing membrane protein YozV
MQEYEKAKSFYRKANQFAKEDSLKVEAFLKEVSCEILDNNFLLALMRLKSFQKPMTTEQKHIKSFLTAMSYYGSENFEKAEEEFLLSLDSSRSKKRTEITNIFDKKRNYMSPNPKVAWWLSLFIPGSGQIYSGDIKNGLNSFFLTATLFYLGARISRSYSYVDAIIGVAPWIQRYYSGGYTHAEDIAIKRRKEKRDKTFQRIYHIIIEDSPASESTY